MTNDEFRMTPDSETSRLATQPTPSSSGIRHPSFPPEAGGGTHVREVHDPFHGDLLEVSMGPHHPSTHGVFRMMVTLDGETIVKLKPVFGYLHRNHEKLGENTT